jgi:hypothetical protein
VNAVLVLRCVPHRCAALPGLTFGVTLAVTGSHHTSDFVFDIIGGLAVLFLVLFAVALARQVRTGDRWRVSISLRTRGPCW